MKKAIEEDWQRPEGFTTRTQREEAARAAKEVEEAEERKAQEREKNNRREKEDAAAAEEWRKTAPPEVFVKIRERVLVQLKEEYPGTEEKPLRVPLRLRENKVIVSEYLEKGNNTG